MRYVSATASLDGKTTVTTLCGTRVEANLAKPTGILDAKGNPIYRVRNQIGFHAA